MRFCMVTTFYLPRHVGGDAVHVQSLARALVRAGHDVEGARAFVLDARARNAASSRYQAAFTTRLAAFAPAADRYALPRLDAHDLRSAAIRRRLDGAGVRAWLAWRAAWRRLRGHA